MQSRTPARDGIVRRPEHLARTTLKHHRPRTAGWYRRAAAAVAAVVLTPALGSAQSYFTDTFNRPNHPNVSASFQGQSGPFSPQAYLESQTAFVSNNQLVLAGNDISGGQNFYGAVVPDRNLNTASGVTAGGGFTIRFDANPVVGGSGTRDGWVGLSAGHTRTGALASYALTTADAGIGVLLRDNGGVQVFDGGAMVWQGGFAPGAGDPTYDLAFTVRTAGITAGGAATIEVRVNGTPVVLGPGEATTRAFTWDRADNYVALAASTSTIAFENTAVDNLSFVPVPEPAYALLAAAAAGVALRRRLGMLSRDPAA